MLPNLEPVRIVRPGFLSAQCHRPVRGRLCSPVAGVEARRVGFGETLLPLSACPVLKEMTAEAGEPWEVAT